MVIARLRGCYTASPNFQLLEEEDPVLQKIASAKVCRLSDAPLGSTIAVTL